MDSKAINNRLELMIEVDNESNGGTDHNPMTSREIRLSLRETPNFVLNITGKCIERLEYLTVLEINYYNKASKHTHNEDPIYDDSSDDEFQIKDIQTMTIQTVNILHKLLKNIFETKKWFQYFLENISEISGKSLIDALITVLSIKLIDLATNGCYPGTQQLRTITNEITQHPQQNKNEDVISVVALYRQLIDRNVGYSVDQLMYKYVSCLEMILGVVVCEECATDETSSKSFIRWIANYFGPKNKYHHFVYLVLENVVLGSANKSRHKYWNYPFYYLQYGNKPKKLIRSSINYLSYSIVYFNKMALNSDSNNMPNDQVSIVDIMCQFQNTFDIVQSVTELLKKASFISRLHVYPDGQLLQWPVATLLSLLVCNSKKLQMKIAISGQLEQFVYFLLCIIEHQTCVLPADNDSIAKKLEKTSIIDLCVQILVKLSTNRVFAVRINNRVPANLCKGKNIFNPKVGFLFEGIVEVLAVSYQLVPLKFQEKIFIFLYNISPYVVRLTELYMGSIFTIFKMTKFSKDNFSNFALFLNTINNHTNYSNFGREYLFYYVLSNNELFQCPKIKRLASVSEAAEQNYNKQIKMMTLILRSMENKFTINDLVHQKKNVLNFLKETILVGGVLEGRSSFGIMDIEIDHSYWNWLIATKNKPKIK